MINELFYWFHFLLWAFLTACALVMWNYCMGDNRRLLSWYRIYLTRRALCKGDIVLYHQCLETKVEKGATETERYYQQRCRDLINSKIEQLAQPFIMWEKPLGLCTICLSPYISFIVFFCTGLQSYFAHGLFFYSLPLWFGFLTTFVFRKINSYI